MSTTLARRPLSILVTAGTLVACAAEARSRQPDPDDRGPVPASVTQYRVESAILADVPIGTGWDVAGDAPPLADAPIGAGWDVP